MRGRRLEDARRAGPRPTPPLSAPEWAHVGALTGTGGTRAALNAADSANRN